MSTRTKALVFGITAGLILTCSAFTIGLLSGTILGNLDIFADLPGFNSNLTPQISTQTTFDTSPPENEEQLFAPFWQTWDIIHEQFVDQPVDDVSLMRGAISGVLDSLGDQHTSYMDPDSYRQANIPLQGSYEGIGAWVDTEAEYLTIVSPMPGSPAEEAGLEPGDQVIAIDGEDMTGVDGSLAVRQVLGPSGTPVTLTILREGEPAPFDVTIVRGEITIPSVVGELIEGDIAYIQLYTFSNETSANLRASLEELMAQDPVGLILDLRGNGGGFLFSAIEVASEFIDQGTIMTERFGDGSEETYDASGDGLATDIPLVVLIDAGSASASEIVAGAIQDYGRGVLVGENSFGKGSVQNWIPLADDGGAVRVTIARWYTPDGHQIHEIGLAPDIPVEFTESDLEADRDPQLEQAVSILHGGATAYWNLMNTSLEVR